MPELIGRHLVLDARTATARGLDDPQVAHALLETLAHRIDATIVFPPLVARFPFAHRELERFAHRLRTEGVDSPALATLEGQLHARAAQESGVTGVVVFAESHASVHTWPERRLVSFDVYSCREFDVDDAVATLLAPFDVAEWAGLDIARALGAPPSARPLSGP